MDANQLQRQAESIPIEIPTKSVSDSRDYRVIRLTNGLTALLISDVNSMNKHIVDGEEDDKEEEESDTGEEEEEEEEESSNENDSNTDEDKSDEKDSLYEEESGGCGLKRTKGVKMAAAGLCVGVGSFSDPPSIPGLAHFLEHMVFMGNEKYPNENSFDAFLKRHGGSDNASTDCETTLFQFEVHELHFRESLDRFAQCFVSPLFKRGSVESEVEIVDSEFKMSLPVDENRKQQIFGSFAVDGHPMRKFMWGNVETLKNEPLKQNIDIIERLLAFWKHHYSAHLMTLAVQSREPLDTLQRWVTESFSDINSNFIPRPTFSQLSISPFDTESFYKIYRVSSVKSSHIVDINWALPSMLGCYRSKPLHYLWFLVGHEGKGSILSYLKRRVWALNLWVDNSECGFEYNSCYALFNVCIELTEEGMVHLYEVLTAVFAYVELLRLVGPQKWVFDEIRTIAENDFQFQEETTSIDYVESLCQNMQLYPSRDYVVGGKLFFDFEAETIANCQNLLTPERSNVMVTSKRFMEDGVCDKREPWFQTIYNESNIDSSWQQTWKDLDPVRFDFHLPLPNKFIATDFGMKEPDILISEVPIKILDDSSHKLWYKKDNRFNVPKAHFNFSFVSSLVLSSPKSSLLLDLFINTLKQNMKEDVYAADAAMLNYNIFGNEVGLIICVYGFNHRLSVLLDLIVDHVVNFSVDDELFAAVVRDLYEGYYNTCIKPHKLCREVRRTVLQHVYWNTIDKRSLVKDLSKDDLLDFVDRLKKSVYIEGLVQGNVTSKEAIELAIDVRCKFGCINVPRTVLPEVCMVQLPRGNHCCRVSSLNGNNCNSAVTNFYQLGPADIHQTCLMELLIDIMEEPCFDVLRTRERLGYDVSCEYVESFGILGLMITVHSQEDRFDCSQVNGKMESFLHTFDELLGNLLQKEFETQVSSLIKLKCCVDLHLKEEVDRNWSEIVSRCYVFNRLQKEIEHMREISLQELKDFYKSVCQTNVRKLGVQVVGNTKKGSESSSVMRKRRLSSDRNDDKCETTDGMKSVQPRGGLKVKTKSKDMKAGQEVRHKKVEVNDIQEMDFEDVNALNGEQPTFQLKFLVENNSVDANGGKIQFVDDIPSFKRNLVVFPVMKITQ